MAPPFGPTKFCPIGQECEFSIVRDKNGHFCQKCPFSDQKKWHFEWPNQNSKTTFIVQTFPKNGPYGFDLVNLSLLGPILAKFQFCWFSGLFWAFFPSKKCKHENLSPNVNFWSITLKFFLWTHTTHEHAWLKGCSSIKKKGVKWDTLVNMVQPWELNRYQKGVEKSPVFWNLTD